MTLFSRLFKSASRRDLLLGEILEAVQTGTENIDKDASFPADLVQRLLEEYGDDPKIAQPFEALVQQGFRDTIPSLLDIHKYGRLSGAAQALLETTMADLAMKAGQDEIPLFSAMIRDMIRVKSRSLRKSFSAVPERIRYLEDLFETLLRREAAQKDNNTALDDYIRRSVTGIIPTRVAKRSQDVLSALLDERIKPLSQFKRIEFYRRKIDSLTPLSGASPLERNTVIRHFLTRMPAHEIEPYNRIFYLNLLKTVYGRASEESDKITAYQFFETVLETSSLDPNVVYRHWDGLARSMNGRDPRLPETVARWEKSFSSFAVGKTPGYSFEVALATVRKNPNIPLALAAIGKAREIQEGSLPNEAEGFLNSASHVGRNLYSSEARVACAEMMLAAYNALSPEDPEATFDRRGEVLGTILCLNPASQEGMDRWDALLQTIEEDDTARAVARCDKLFSSEPPQAAAGKSCGKIVEMNTAQTPRPGVQPAEFIGALQRRPH